MAVFEENRLPAHAWFLPYSTPEKALSFQREQADDYSLLNGTWKFQWVKSSIETPK